MAKLSFGVSGVNPSKVGGVNLPNSSNSIGIGPGGSKLFPRLSGPGATSIFGSSAQTGQPMSLVGNQIPPFPSSFNATGALMLPASGRFEGQQFDVLASGNFGKDVG